MELIFPQSSIPESGCPQDHEALHQEFNRLLSENPSLRGTGYSTARDSIAALKSIPMNNLQAISQTLITLNCIRYQAMEFFKPSLFEEKELMGYLPSTLNISKCILNFTEDINRGYNTSCPITKYMDVVLQEMISIIHSVRKLLPTSATEWKSFQEESQMPSRGFQLYFGYLNCLTMVLEVYNERRRRSGQSISEEEVYYWRFFLKSPTVKSRVFPPCEIRKELKNRVMKSLFFHVSNFYSIEDFGGLPEEVKDQWKERKKLTPLENTSTDCCICFKQFKDAEYQVFLSGCVHVDFCHECVFIMTNRYDELKCPKCRNMSFDFIKKTEFHILNGYLTKISQ